ncbi:TonB-dependent hemoglobin/transferrin/lactoferrin family receptor [Pasteurella multocida]|uniref:TonB-dependent hemoglobin/transferrin/lactoferrin family receptor n=1 Tax=Pasteurella multocida (strain Pm70) TaxID=272843 RepID=Q9CNX2_PASMU|nr:TonB-dependent hemoglobin/transferrin/lactoferrin family receptor [Pasteurella multocida]AAK02384.1 unknown [Pasteurella multocida subsp. multocida str. Pm70]APW54907.1 hemoglobin-binding protein A [Pasteurella multocida subsp. multocida str. HN07]AUL52999.1 ligand-gated channel protein [Pasteurella multocida]AWB54337.1 TonB-dependent hemoglobin/transferrin/lactoferrin family receptor [Pasteurella multocida]MCL7804857.1 TonB-dependent hemoglobin/transferrin/lactoferrin family receptor [Past
MRTTTIKFSAITLALLSYCGAILADSHQEATELDTITVSSQQDEMNIKEKKVGETVKTASQLKRQQVQDSRDLVRYETGVTVVEAGRFGSSGYAIRGVDENRVAITVDGLHQAETLSSQGFKELFEGYGNFNNTRNSVEIETLKVAKIAKGADSVKVGSGSLGGAVLFETKDARDFLTEKDWHIGYKAGYSTADNQGLNAVTLAGRYQMFDALIMHSKRHGHELENYDYKNGRDIQGKEREKADPYTITKESTLVKFSFSPTENHRFTVASDTYIQRSRGHDRSYSLQPQSNYFTYDEKESRHANDLTKRKNVSFTYENYSITPFWDTLKLSYSQQKIRTRARTEDYCDGNEKCDSYKNPLGLQLKDGKIVDPAGNQITLKGTGFNTEIVDKDGKPFPTTSGTNNAAFSNNLQLSPTGFWLDCTIFDCTKPFTVYNYKQNKYEPREVMLSEEITIDGKLYKTAKEESGVRNYLILPNSKGYLPYDYKERDLDSNTKQINLDLTKTFSTFNIENELLYGAIYSRTEKKMVNKAGYDGRNPTWWADRILGKSTNCNYNGLKCPRHEPLTSFLIPVEATTKSLYFSDNIKLHNMLSVDLGYRYDDIKYQPEYIPGVTPKIADDMVKGIFIPLPKGEKIKIGNYETTKPLTPEQIRKNAEENIAYIAQEKRFKKHSYSLGATFDPLNFLRVQVKYSKGFRAPTSDELYFTFKHPDFTILPNPVLKPEEAKNQEIALTVHDNWGFVSTSVFQTKYRHFIDLAYLGSRNLSNSVGGKAQARDFQVYQNVNVDNAKVKGVEINARLNLGYFWHVLDGFNTSYKFTYQRGRLDGDRPMNAIQPKASVFGLGYDHKENKFGADLYITRVSEKKAKDTYNMFYKEQGYKDSAIRWRSDDYTLIDAVGYIKPIKNLTLQFGVYNLTDRKYLTWESARSIKPFGTSNLINQKTGAGINRFYSPGRNFKLSAEITF